MCSLIKDSLIYDDFSIPKKIGWRHVHLEGTGRAAISPISNAACIERGSQREGVSQEAGAPLAPCLALPGGYLQEGHLMPMMRLVSFSSKPLASSSRRRVHPYRTS